MPDFKNEINYFLTETFNNILAFEQKQIAKSAKHLTINDVHIIEQIGPEGNKKMTDIAENMGITLATMTAAADRLERKGCIKRERSTADRRIVLLSLTRDGMITYKLHHRFHMRMVDKIVEGLNSAELQLLSKMLSKLNSFFKDES
jgi:DNA-binding MarR family transcriptional regulator